MKHLVFGLLMAVTATVAVAQSADSNQKRLEAESVKLKTWTQDPLFVAAVTAQNKQHITPAEIDKRDKAWVAGKATHALSRLSISAGVMCCLFCAVTAATNSGS